MAFREFTGELDAPVATQPTGKFREFTGELDPQPMTAREAFESHPVTRLVRGIEGPAITLMKMVGPDSIKQQLGEIDQLRESGMKKRGNEGFDWAGLVGSLVPGGAIAKGIGATVPAATALGKVGQGFLTGSATAAAQPLQGGQEELSTDKLKQALTGGLFGAGTAAIPAAYQSVKSLVEPFYEKGRNAIIGRTLTNAAGGQAPQAARAMQAAREIVPGSIPTVGQASGNAGLASLERAASAIDPEITVQFANRAKAQNAARLDTLRNIAGTDADYAFAEGMRDKSTAPLLNRINNSPAQVDTSRTLSLIDSMMNKAPGRKQLVNALAEVRSSLLDPNGAPRSNVGQLYQGARKNIADLLAAKAGDGSKVNAAISRELTTVMHSLDNQIGKAEPAYKQFLYDYPAMSKPLNRMDVARTIEEQSVNPLTETIKPNSYARALSDKVAQKATGFKRATLQGTMTPGQMNDLNAIKDDLARMVTAEQSAGTAGSDTVKKLAYSNMMDKAGVPTFLRGLAPMQVVGNMAARGLDVAYGDANRRIAHELAMTLLDPKKAAQVMRSGQPNRYQAIVDAMMQGTAGTAAGRTY